MTAERSLYVMATSCVSRTLREITFPRCGLIDLFLERITQELKVLKLKQKILKITACTGADNSRQTVNISKRDAHYSEAGKE